MSAIPICLAATIILNTMLGTVMERRKEIGIYNSIGLNPTHVFVFFVAEALVFGLIGAVAGYLGGRVDSVMMRIVDVLYSLPSIIFVIVLLTTLGGWLKQWLGQPLQKYWERVATWLVRKHRRQRPEGSP
jgi:ABC-type antimicrobial peptide transport system permease subunit